MTRTEEGLLLYLETRAVDYFGKIDVRHINSEDREILARWHESNFVKSGRIAFNDIKKPEENMWCLLSEEAVDAAHWLRKQRIERSWRDKRYTTTEELKEVEQQN